MGHCHPSPFSPAIPLWGLSHSCTDFFVPVTSAGTQGQGQRSSSGLRVQVALAMTLIIFQSHAVTAPSPAECPGQPPAAPLICISPHKPLQHCFLGSFQASLNLDSLLSKTSQSSKTQRKDSLLQGASLKPHLPLELPSAPVLSSLPPTKRTQSICLPR